MDQPHNNELLQFERLLSQVGAGRIAERMQVVKVFLGRDAHLDAQGWRQAALDEGLEFDPQFVSETLELLVKLGLASRRPFDEGPPRYEHQHLGEHHDHLICTKCGSITEFEDPALEVLKMQAAQAHGFHHLSHRLQIYGLCGKCLANRAPALPLTMASNGEEMRVVRLAGGEKAQKHLLDLGITVGASLKVISNSGGPVVVAVRGARLALGRGAAQKVHVCPEDSGYAA